MTNKATVVSLDIFRPTTVSVALDDKSHREYVLFLNGLLPLLDFTCLLSAAYIAIALYPSVFAPAVFDIVRGQEHVIITTIAFLAPALLYDRRFVAVASRGQYRALVRCFLTGASLFAVGMTIVGFASGLSHEIPRGVLALWLLASLVLTGIARVMLTTLIQQCVRRGLLVDTVAVVGAGAHANRLIAMLRRMQPMTPHLLGVFADAKADEGGPALAGTVDDLLALGRERRIDWILLAIDGGDEHHLLALVHRLKALSVPIALCPQNLRTDATSAIDYIADDLPVTLLRYPLPSWRANIRVFGQFLPRWITTLLTALIALAMLALGALRARWPRRLQRRTDFELRCEIDNFTLEEFVEVANNFGQSRFGFVVTPNVDHLIRLHDQAMFRSVYADADYVLLDSRFLANVLRITEHSRLPVCAGSDLTTRLLSTADDERIVIVGGSDAQVRALTKRFGINNVAHYSPPFGFIRDPEAVKACLEFVEAYSPFRFCFLAVGSPQQEILAQQLRERGVARGLALCVGASIDFLTGVERRAPQWMQRAGCEWFFRLAHNPRRLAKRYLVRGPRIFWLLRKTTFVLRSRHAPQPVAAARAA